MKTTLQLKKNENGEMKIQFLSFPGYWWGKRKENKENAFLSQILLFKKKKMCENDSSLTLRVHVLKARTVLPIPFPVWLQPFGWNVFHSFGLIVLIFVLFISVSFAKNLPSVGLRGMGRDRYGHL